MGYYITLSIPFDLENISLEASAGKRPRHTMWALKQELNARIHQPDTYPVSSLDNAFSYLLGQPQHWAMARALSRELTQNDLIFCAAEDTGFPLAILCRDKIDRPNLVVTVMAPERLRVKHLSKLMGLGNVIDLFMTNTEIKANFIRRHLHLPKEKVYVIPEQTDEHFFTPGPALRHKSRPLVASAGREQRDYQTLALATQDLDVDVEVCAISPNASRSTRVLFPNPIPPNMSFYPHDWPDFRQLYRDADVVVISLLDNHYSAGLTSLMEAMACRRPIIMTNTPGLAEQFIRLGIVHGINPGDVSMLQQSITYLLEHPNEAESLAEKGYQFFRQHHTSQQYVSRIAQEVHRLLPKERIIIPSSVVVA